MDRRSLYNGAGNAGRFLLVLGQQMQMADLIKSEKAVISADAFAWINTNFGNIAESETSNCCFI